MAKKASEQKSATFVYEGLDRQGKKIKGETTGKGPALVRAELRKQGIQAKRVTKKREVNLGGKKKIKPMDIAIFTRQMATMMKAGVPLVQSFEIVADGLSNPSMKDVVMKLKVDVEGGNNFANALRNHPLLFDDLYCSLVDAGEQSGSLEVMLDRVALYKEKSEALKLKVKKALKYPISVICVAIIVTGILLVKVVPTFKDLFEGFGAELPAFTQFVIGISDILIDNFLIFIVSIIAFIFIFTEAKKRSKAFRDAIDRLLLKLPIVGDITFKATIARYARTLSTTFSAGVPLIDALDACAGATGNVVYRNAVLQVKDDVSTGQQLQFAMRSTGVFPAMALQMTAIGEESGALDAMLEKVAIYYEEEVDAAVDGLTSMMEPLIMSVLGVLIGGLIIAMYLPIFQLGQVV
ncbi:MULTISPECIES: type II secretion system F family protein [unclassified Alcanivorax]|uniref:type II secretion system F family protein n=1 Tax=unclassified Alcanivorax TaxID=2638842 RepID=UPI0008A08D4F|nr:MULTISPECIES: type II secretion system F family protein [unclassified Alcanivorax]SEF48911.1 type II secretion system protein F (GspF) [Alcanivorax sp. DSM 26293]